MKELINPKAKLMSKEEKKIKDHNESVVGDALKDFKAGRVKKTPKKVKKG